MNNNWSLYLLENSENKKTYLGVTVNIKRRIRQHNCELKGGAKYTSSNKGNGSWILKTIINDLTKSEALSYERIIKNKRRKGRGKTPYDRRMFLINSVIEDKIIETFQLNNSIFLSAIISVKLSGKSNLFLIKLL